MTATPDTTRPHDRRRPLRVLVVDDDPDNRDTLAELIRLFGHEARTARSAAEAVEQAGASPPDVALLDIGLPGEDGYAVGRRLREAPGRWPVLVAVTGHERLEWRSASEGFDHHLVKPVEADLLAALLDRYADSLAPGRAPGAPHPITGQSERLTGGTQVDLCPLPPDTAGATEG
jgi:CheY-like chemotaxis protein